MICVSIFVNDECVVFKNRVEFDGKVSVRCSGPCPLNIDLKFFSGMITVWTYNDWVVVNFVIVLVPLFGSSCICYLEISKGDSVLIRIPAVLWDINLI